MFDFLHGMFGIGSSRTEIERLRRENMMLKLEIGIRTSPFINLAGNLLSARRPFPTHPIDLATSQPKDDAQKNQ